METPILLVQHGSTPTCHGFGHLQEGVDDACVVHRAADIHRRKGRLRRSAMTDSLQAEYRTSWRKKPRLQRFPGYTIDDLQEPGFQDMAFAIICPVEACDGEGSEGTGRQPESSCNLVRRSNSPGEGSLMGRVMLLGVVFSPLYHRL